MPGPNRINFVGLFCSCVGHATILGGIIYGLAYPARPQLALAPSSEPLVVQLLPLGRSSELEEALAAGNGRDATHEVRPADDERRVEKVKAVAAIERRVRPSAARREGALHELQAGNEISASAPDFSDYQRRLYEALARSSRYPQEARRMHLAGITRLAFRVDRLGTVLDSWIQESSGSELLDSAALDALDRAQPLPPIPAGLPQQMEFVIEIDLSVMQQFAGRTAG